MQDALSIPARDMEHERVLGIVFELSPAQASVLSCLARGTVATTEQLLEYSGTQPPMKVVISRTRAKMRTHKAFDNVTKPFDIKNRIGVGYWIEKEHSKLIDKAVKDFLERR